jgi:MoaA/NifB/PqqE/SkfB family radical SAM enzyme
VALCGAVSSARKEVFSGLFRKSIAEEHHIGIKKEKTSAMTHQVNTSSRDCDTEDSEYGFALDWHRHFPPMLVISITNVCNLKCTHCYYTKFSKLQTYHRNMLPWSIWTRICDETSNWKNVILNFGTDGEPLCHPRFLDMVRYARKRGIWPINLTTNGLLMTEGFVQAVCEENLVDVINVSIDAATGETYQKIRGGNFDRVTANVRKLIEARNRTGATMKIQVNFIDQPESNSELDLFRRQWEGKADQILIRTYYDATSVTGETGPNITGKQKTFEQVDRWPCQQFWRRFNISDDGMARFCVDDWFNRTKIGDLNHSTISEIWTSRAYDDLRRQHLQNRFDENPYCAKCSEWQGMRWDYDYFLAMQKLLGTDFLGVGRNV